MILFQLILASLVVGQARDDLRVYRWKHNNPKEDPLQRKSFQALVPGTCDEEISIQDEMKGQIVTEGFDQFYYANNSDCTWELVASDDLKLSYEIAYMDIEPGPPFCPFDYLTVEKELDGEWATQVDPSFQWQRYCGAMRPMGFIETDSSKVRFKFVSDDNEHGRGVAINWKSYKKDVKIEELKEDFFTEQVIDFEEGWPWNFITRDPAYPDAFEWKLNRGYTNSVGTGPKSDRTTQSVYGTYAYFDTSEPVNKDDIGVFSTYPVKIDQESEKPYCLQFYSLLFGDAFGDMLIMAKYHDENGDIIKEMEIGKIEPVGPPMDYWQPFAFEMSQTEGPLLSLSFIARRGKSPQGDFTLDDMVWFHGNCNERTMFPLCPRQMANPMSGGRAVGYWNCTDANMLGSECDLVCMIGHMVTPNMNSTNSCTENGPYGGWDQDPTKLTCVKEYCPLPMPPSEGLWFFGCTDESGHKDGVVTSGGLCEIKCLPGYERVTPQLIRCERRHWEHYKLSTGNTNGKMVDPDDIKCVKIPEEELTDFEKKKIEHFEPPKQLGIDDVNEVAPPTKQPTTTKKTTTPKANKQKDKPEKKTETKEKEPEEEAPKTTTEKEQIVTTTESKTSTTKEPSETKATVKPQTIKSKETESVLIAPPNPETTQASFMELDTTQAPIDEVTKPEKQENEKKKDDKPSKSKKGSSKKKPDSVCATTLSILLLFLLLL